MPKNDSGILPQSQEIERLEGLEQGLRKALTVHLTPDTARAALLAADAARAALQTEVNKLNSSQVSKENPNSLPNLVRQLVREDLWGYQTAEGHQSHFPTIEIEHGQINVLADEKIVADENEAKDCNSHHRNLNLFRLPAGTRKLIGFAQGIIG